MHPLSQLTIRRAKRADCAAMNEIRAASITQLCTPDHGDDPDVLSMWVNNQSAETFQQLLERPDVVLLVGEFDGVAVAVGGINGDKVTLNYVHPDYRFRGISKALMAGLEGELVASGITLAYLDSTATALPFYRALDWVQTGSGDPDQGYPMEKRL
jgi:GNAT superfamily N-acetyltransferase